MRNLLVFILSMLALSALAQTNTNSIPASTVPGGDGVSWFLIAIPVVVPVVVAFGKMLLPKVPTWLLPILAPLLGALADYLTTRITGGTASPVLAAALGSAGVGIREIVDQIKQKAAPQPVKP